MWAVVSDIQMEQSNEIYSCVGLVELSPERWSRWVQRGGTVFFVRCW